MSFRFDGAIAVFRIYSLEKAREFYVGFLGFGVDWEHRFEPDAPVYLQISRDGLCFHLSEHHGDGTPGSVAYVPMQGIASLHRELNEKNYRHNRPGLERTPWGTLEMTVIDPFGNRIRFGEPAAPGAT